MAKIEFTHQIKEIPTETADSSDWQASCNTLQEVLNIIYDPLYTKRDQLTALKEQIDRLAASYLAENQALKTKLHAEKSIRACADVVKGLGAHEKLRRQVEALVARWEALFNYEGAYNSLYDEMNVKTPDELPNGADDSDIEHHRLQYAYIADSKFAEAFQLHSNRAINRLHSDLSQLVTQSLDDLQQVARDERPYRGTRFLFRQREAIYQRRKQQIEERRIQLQENEIVVHTLMYERMNQFLQGLPVQLFGEFYQRLTDYTEADFKKSPAWQRLLTTHRQTLIENISQRMAMMRGGGVGSAAGNYWRVVDTYNAYQVEASANSQSLILKKNATRVTYRNIIGAVRNHYQQQPPSREKAINRYVDRVLKEYLAQTNSWWFRWTHRNLNAVAWEALLKQHYTDNIDAAITKAPAVMRDEVRTILNKAPADGQQKVAEAIVGEALGLVKKPQWQHNPWTQELTCQETLQQQERDSAIEVLRHAATTTRPLEGDYRRLANFIELKKTFKHRFSSDTLIDSLTQLALREPLTEKQLVRLGHYLSLLLPRNLPPAKRQWVECLHNLMNGSLTPDLAGEARKNGDQQLTGYAHISALEQLLSPAARARLEREKRFPGEGFLARLIKNFVPRIINLLYDQVMDDVDRGETDAKSAATVKFYLQIFAAYLPNDRSLDVYRQRSSAGRDYFLQLLTAPVGDVTSINPIDAIAHWKHVNLYADMTQAVGTQQSLYLEQFDGRDLSYAPLFRLTGHAFVDKDGYDNFFHYGKKVIDALIDGNRFVDQGVFPQGQRHADSNSYVTLFPQLLAHNGNAHYLQRRLNDYITNTTLPWNLMAQYFIETYGNPEQKRDYRLKGLSQLLQKPNVGDITAFRQCMAKFPVDYGFYDYASAKLGSAITDKIKAEAQLYAHDPSVFFEDVGVQHLVDVFFPKQTFVYRLHRLDALLHFCAQNDSASKTAQVSAGVMAKGFINYFLNERARILNVENLASTDFAQPNQDYDFEYFANGSHQLAALSATFRRYFVEGTPWSMNIQRLICTFGSKVDALEYFLKGLRETLNQPVKARAWIATITSLSHQCPSLEPLIGTHCGAEISAALKAYIDTDIVGANKPVDLAIWHLVSNYGREHLPQLRRARVRDIMAGRVIQFWQENSDGVDEVGSYKTEKNNFKGYFGIDPTVDGFSNSEFYQNCEAYICSTERHELADVWLQELGFIKFFPHLTVAFNAKVESKAMRRAFSEKLSQGDMQQARLSLDLLREAGSGSPLPQAVIERNFIREGAGAEDEVVKKTLELVLWRIAGVNGGLTDQQLMAQLEVDLEQQAKIDLRQEWEQRRQANHKSIQSQAQLDFAAAKTRCLAHSYARNKIMAGKKSEPSLEEIQAWFGKQVKSLLSWNPPVYPESLHTWIKKKAASLEKYEKTIKGKTYKSDILVQVRQQLQLNAKKEAIDLSDERVIAELCEQRQSAADKAFTLDPDALTARVKAAKTQYFVGKTNADLRAEYTPHCLQDLDSRLTLTEQHFVQPRDGVSYSPEIAQLLGVLISTGRECQPSVAVDVAPWTGLLSLLVVGRPQLRGIFEACLAALPAPVTDLLETVGISLQRLFPIKPALMTAALEPAVATSLSAPAALGTSTASMPTLASPLKTPSAPPKTTRADRARQALRQTQSPAKLLSALSAKSLLSWLAPSAAAPQPGNDNAPPLPTSPSTPIMADNNETALKEHFKQLGNWV